MFDTMSRWVERTGTTVRFGNVVGTCIGKPYRYEFPTEALAEQFEKSLLDKDEKPLPVDEKWKPYFKGMDTI